MFWLAINLLFALGLVVAWFYAKPLEPFKKFLVIKSSNLNTFIRSYRRSGDTVGLLRRLLAWPVWWFNGLISCPDCFSPYAGAAAAYFIGPGDMPIGAVKWCVVVAFITLTVQHYISRLIRAD